MNFKTILFCMCVFMYVWGFPENQWSDTVLLFLEGKKIAYTADGSRLNTETGL